MDTDLAPGMVTVLQGKDLKLKGFRTVYDALASVPGINTSSNSVGDQYVSVRGIGGNIFSGNLKLMLDGVVLNDSMSAAGYTVYQIPTEQIEKIEIIRGPGSVIYGEYAYAGVINITTVKQGSRIYGNYDSHDNYGGGGTLTYSRPEKKFSVNLNFSGWDSDGADTEAGKDRLWEKVMGIDLSRFSHAPGPVNEAEKDRLAALSLKYGDFSLTAQYVSNIRGDHFGIINMLPPSDDRPDISHEHRALEAAHSLKFSDSFKTDIKAGWRQYGYEIDNITGLPAMTITMSSLSGIPFSTLSSLVSIFPNLKNGMTTGMFTPSPPDGVRISADYKEREIYGGAEFIWKESSRNTFLLGIKYSDTEVLNADGYSNMSEKNWGQMTRSDWFDRDKKRNVFSAYLQDMFAISKYFTLTGGLRYDDYSDMGTSVTPRLSAVWQAAEHHILKAQYSEALRPPSFTELYAKDNVLVKGNPDLESAHIRSYELGYIYRKPETIGRVTLFYSELEDNIQYPSYADSLFGMNIQYRNADGTVKTKGIELEAEHEIRADLRLWANLSFSDTEDENGKPLEGAADRLGNIGLNYQPNQNYVLGLQYHYVSDRHRAQDDPRDDLKAYHTVDLTGNGFNLFTKGLTLKTGVKNLFDTDIVYPAPVFRNQDGTIGYYYRDDFMRPGRTIWFEISYDFK